MLLPEAVTMDYFADKRVLVMGLGTFGGGLDAALFAARAGAKVTVTDMADEKKLAGSLQQLDGLDITYHLGGHLEADFGPDGHDIIIVNPAVPPDNAYLKMAEDAGHIVTSQVEIFFLLCMAPIVGITGANGKSTTTSLTAHLLTAGEGQAVMAYRKVWLSGNIGHRPLLTGLSEIRRNDLVVLELSSFQLEQLARIRRAPFVSVITNVTPNHLDRHGTFEAYCDAKEHIFRHQRLHPDRPCISIFNAEDEITLGWYEKYHHDMGRWAIKFHADDVPEYLLKPYTLVGRANRSNLAAALKVAELFGVNDSNLRQAVSTFKPLPHRLEIIAEINGVRWYNDSIATTPPSAIAALEAFDCPRIIIAGGYDKKLPFDEFGIKIAESAKAAVLIGQTAPHIAKAIENAGVDHSVMVQFADSLEAAVHLCAELADPGDVVLLSPACASYDMFDNFVQRAEVFIRSVKALQV